MLIAVAVNVYKESASQVWECFSRIKSNLSGTVKVFLDGVDRQDAREIALLYGFRVEQGEHLGCNESSPLWWMRMLSWFEECEADVCFKLDPDTMVDRPPNFPDEDYFGSIECVNSHGVRYVQGGVSGFSKRSVKLLAGGVLADPKWDSVENYEEDSSPPFCDDKMIGHALREMGIVPFAWDECFSRWQVPVENEDFRYSIVHPRYY